MAGRRFSSLLLALLVVATPAAGQRLPVTTSSEEARRHFLLGRDAAHHYQFVEAREHLDQAIEADPTFVLAHLHRAGSAAFVSEIREYLGRAESNRSRASAGEQRMIDAFQAFLQGDDYARAVAIFDSLAATFPGDPYLPSYLGLRYYRNLGRHDDATAQFRRALERDSGFVQAYNWLGHIALDQGDPATAERHFLRYAQEAPDEPRPHHSLGVLRLRQGRHEEAARHFERALAVDPRLTDSRDDLARARIEQANARFEEAFGRRDAGALAALYTASAVLLPPGGAPMAGAEAIERHWRQTLVAAPAGVELETREVFAGADDATATEIGRYRQTGAGPEPETGTYVVVWLRTPDGWRIHRDVRVPLRAAEGRN